MGKRGRKPKPLAEKLRNRIAVNLNDKEYVGLVALAEEAGETPPMYARLVLARHISRRTAKRSQ